MAPKADLSTKIFTLFIVLGIVLSFVNYLNNRSLWLDEAFLALNIVHKPVGELLAPLDLNQVAPIGFLIIEKCFATLFGNTDWSLRILPLVSFLLSIPLIASIASQVTGEKRIGLFSAAWFSLSFWPLYFSSEVKQYMLDVFICLTLILLTLNFLKRQKEYFPLVLAGVASVWLSNIAVILLFCGGLLLLHNTIKKPDQLLFKTILVLSSWIFSFGIYYIFFIHDHPSEKYMLTYWERDGSFLPQNIFSSSFYASLLRQAKTYFGLLGTGKLGLLVLPFFLTGLLHLVKHKSRICFLFIFPVVIHLTLSYFKAYPFSSRLILYLYPLLIIIITVGVYRVFSIAALKRLQIIALSGILVLSSLLIALKDFPFEREEIKNSIAYLDANAAPTDQLYIYHTTAHAFLFYQEKFSAYPVLEANDNVIISKSSRKDWAQYDKSISAIRSAPVWLLFSHVYRPKEPKGSISEEEYILEKLEANGFKIIDQQNYTGSTVYKAVPVSPPRPSRVIRDAL